MKVLQILFLIAFAGNYVCESIHCPLRKQAIKLAAKELQLGLAKSENDFLSSNMVIIKEILNTTPDVIEKIYERVLPDCVENKKMHWTITMPMEPIPPDTYEFHSPSDKPLKIVHITDIHYDPNYTDKTFLGCGSAPLCCQPEQKSNTHKLSWMKPAKWGNYEKCDTPMKSIINAFRHINKQHHDMDYVYFTGNIVSHGFLDATVESNIRSIKTVMKQIGDTFDVPVFPILGNHDTHQINLFLPKNHPNSTQWLFELVADEWSKWLPVETRETILKGGYYTHTPKPGFRIIALNSNVCNVLNYWNIKDDVDPFGQLQWLTLTLLLAEKNGEAVHILAHVPSGKSCYYTWNENFKNIVQRYHNTIRAIFNGYTHMDEFIVYYDDQKDKSLAVAYNGGCITPYSNGNPNYKVYDVQRGSFDILDFKTWTYNLTEANMQEYPNWYKLYSFKDAYGMENLHPSNFAALVERLKTNDTLMQQYDRFKQRDSDAARKTCGDICKQSNICSIVGYDDEKCKIGPVTHFFPK